MVVHCCNLLRRNRDKLGTFSGLVVGCGNGDEVVFMRRSLHTQAVVGVDLHADFSPAARDEGCVLLGNAERLPFRSDDFDFAAAFHSLEHVSDPQVTLNEIQRVLRPGGLFYMGVPNRSRVLGYLGAFDATPWQKITWNLTDWGARLRGRFRNELGAHAGFSRQEIISLLGQRFSEVQLLTADFLRFKYAERLPRAVLNALLASPVIDYSAAAHYAICRKKEKTS